MLNGLLAYGARNALLEPEKGIFIAESDKVLHRGKATVASLPFQAITSQQQVFLAGRLLGVLWLRTKTEAVEQITRENPEALAWVVF